MFIALIFFALGILFSFLSLASYSYYLTWKKNKQIEKDLELIQGTISSLVFDKRVGNNVIFYTTFKGIKRKLVLFLDTSTIAVYDIDNQGQLIKCILDHNVYKERNKGIAKQIYKEYYSEISDVTVLNGIAYSNNIFKMNKKDVESYYKQYQSQNQTQSVSSEIDIDPQERADEILDQISESGIESISKEDLDFLKKYSSR